MLKILRSSAILAIALQFSVGAAVAQAQMATAPPISAPAMQATPKTGGNPNRKCGQTPKGCHKNEATPKPQGNPNRKCGQTPKGCHKNEATPKPKPPQ
jgi:hypothetical protein